MKTLPKAVFNWSGGKDSAHALWRAIRSGQYDIVALLTTVNRSTRLSTMHDIPPSLLQRQADSIGIPLHIVELTPKGNMEDYAREMGRAVEHFRQEGVTHFIFGDIFLHDVRRYREEQLRPLGIEVVEPLWDASSGEVIEAFLQSGLKCMVVTAPDEGLGREAIGRIIDRAFIRSLPPTMDPNGENGEYHTFCYDGPIFSHPVAFETAGVHHEFFDVGLDDGTHRRYGYWFTDLRSADDQTFDSPQTQNFPRGDRQKH